MPKHEILQVLDCTRICNAIHIFMQNCFFTEHTCDPLVAGSLINSNVTYNGYTLGSTAVESCKEGYFSNNTSLENITLTCNIQADPNVPAAWQYPSSSRLTCIGQSIGFMVNCFFASVNVYVDQGWSLFLVFVFLSCFFLYLVGPVFKQHCSI